KGKTPLGVNGLSIGKSHVQVGLPGYDPIDFKVQVEEDKVANVGVLQLHRSVGSVKIESEPSGKPYELTVKQSDVAGEDVPKQTGVTPAVLDKLPTGIYEVIIRNEGWPDQRRTVKIEAGKAAIGRAEFVTGSLQIESLPGGASVWE